MEPSKDLAMGKVTHEECYLLAGFKIKCRADDGLDVRCDGP